MLYLFITTPVSVYHHHSGSKDAGPGPDKGESAFKSDGESMDDECRICSYHFSVYSGDAAILIEIFAPFTEAIEALHLQPVELYAFSGIPGRGPPLHASSALKNC